MARETASFEEAQPSFTEEDKKHVEELERKKQVKRENRLKKIVEQSLSLLQSLFPEEAGSLEIVYEEIRGAESSIFKGERIEFSSLDLPAYGILLRLKSNPEKKYQIMCWLRPDLDAKKETFEMLSNQISDDRIKKGVEELMSKE